MPTKLSSNLYFAWHFTILLCKDANHSDVTFELLHGKLYMYRFAIWDWFFVPSLYKSSNRNAQFSNEIFLHTITHPSKFHCLFRQPASSLSLPKFCGLPLWCQHKQTFSYKHSQKRSVIVSAMIYAITCSFIRACSGTSWTNANLEMKGGV